MKVLALKKKLFFYRFSLLFRMREFLPQVQHPVTHDHVYAQSIAVLTASYETTANALGHIIYALGTYYCVII